MDKFLKIGHRGAKGHSAENTLESFQKAIDLGCDGIELDVHLSADHELIVIHDETVDRTTNGNGRAENLSLSELRMLRIEGKFTIPKLSEVFELVNKRQLINIEIKTAAATKPVVELVEKYVSEKHWKYSHFLISSFDWNVLKKISEIHPKIPLGVLTETNLDDAIGFAESIKAATIHPDFQLLNLQRVAQMQQKGFGVFAWTVNNLADIEQIKSFNVNGIITDFPDRL